MHWPISGLLEWPSFDFTDDGQLVYSIVPDLLLFPGDPASSELLTECPLPGGHRRTGAIAQLALIKGPGRAAMLRRRCRSRRGAPTCATLRSPKRRG